MGKGRGGGNGFRQRKVKSYTIEGEGKHRLRYKNIRKGRGEGGKTQGKLNGGQLLALSGHERRAINPVHLR